MELLAVCAQINNFYKLSFKFCPNSWLYIRYGMGLYVPNRHSPGMVSNVLKQLVKKNHDDCFRIYTSNDSCISFSEIQKLAELGNSSPKLLKKSKTEKENKKEKEKENQNQKKRENQKKKKNQKEKDNRIRKEKKKEKKKYRNSFFRTDYNDSTIHTLGVAKQNWKKKKDDSKIKYSYSDLFFPSINQPQKKTSIFKYSNYLENKSREKKTNYKRKLNYKTLDFDKKMKIETVTPPRIVINKKIIPKLIDEFSLLKDSSDSDSFDINLKNKKNIDRSMKNEELKNDGDHESLENDNDFDFDFVNEDLQNKSVCIKKNEIDDFILIDEDEIKPPTKKNNKKKTSSKEWGYVEIINKKGKRSKPKIKKNEKARKGEDKRRRVKKWEEKRRKREEKRRRREKKKKYLHLKIEFTEKKILKKNKSKTEIHPRSSNENFFYSIIVSSKIILNFNETSVESSKNKNKNKNNHWVPIIIYLPTRLGLAKLNPRYIEPLTEVMKFPQSIGIIGGKPNTSFYFIGIQNKSFFFLDPHRTQKYKGEFFSSTLDTSSFIQRSIYSINIESIEPSIAIGFLLKDENDFQDFISRATEFLKKFKNAPIFSITN
ncbi:cysteine protease atg4 [Anaeramoeba flamelloides]|uniref:Cysteine protease n=1 Tax=Anaeramoeba flamelloides TaxID=1746091 RepID=A0AAV8A4P0_9EUKA|nr:cysteine protease atg4 [Anaeramoeba flamelloides]